MKKSATVKPKIEVRSLGERKSTVVTLDLLGLIAGHPGGAGYEARISWPGVYRSEWRSLADLYDGDSYDATDAAVDAFFNGCLEAAKAAVR